jgi:hypothetical protein
MLQDTAATRNAQNLYHLSPRLYNSLMSRFQVGDLVRISKHDILRPGDAGIVRKVLANPTGDESLQEYIIEFGDRVMDEVSEEGFRLRIHSDARLHCYLSIYLEDANEPVD